MVALHGFCSRNVAVNSLIPIGIVGSLSSPFVSAKLVTNRVEPISKYAFTLYVKQATLVNCVLGKSGIDDKLALKKSVFPVC